MPSEPPVKRAVVFVDGQNLFHATREAFGYTYPNYDVLALAQAGCAPKGWALTQTRFYTGIPDPEDDARWHDFWSAKMAVWGVRVSTSSRGLCVTGTGPCAYRTGRRTCSWRARRRASTSESRWT